jgi:hypothetical protein
LVAIAIASDHAAWASGTLCVNNNVDLALALNAAQGTTTTIHLARGTYDLKGSVWAGVNASNSAPFKDGSSLLGGYSSDCSSRNIDVDNTVIGNSAKSGMSVTASGDATFEGLTFNDKSGLEVYTYNNKSGAEILFRRDVFTGVNLANSRPLNLEWSPSAAASGTFRVVDTLVYGNNNPGNQSIGAITVNRFTGNPKIEFVNNTVVDNTGSMDGIGIYASVGIQFYAYNNILFNNGALDLHIETGSNTTLINNDIGTYLIPNPDNAPVALLRGNPKLDTNFKPIESPVSPVINAGTDNVIGGLPSTDLPGRDREIGSEPDLGAYESSINDSIIQQVTNANDSGVGSLRAAVEGANANGSSGAIITFGIGSSCGPQVIHLQTPLPSVTAETHILGFTQPGSSVNSLDDGDNSVICIILDGNTNQIADGFTVANSAPNAAALSVGGIAFSGFTHSALNLRGGVGHYVDGIRTGGSVGGFNLLAVDYGIILGPGVHGATIGAANDEAARNVLGGAATDAIHIDESSGSTVAAHDNQIVNNYIGVLYNGTTPVANGAARSGVWLGGYNNTVQNNTFGFNSMQAIYLLSADSHDNTVTNNLIGTDFEGSTIANNDGITIDTGAHDNDLSDNIVDNNNGNGVTMLGASVHNSLLGSTFANNRGLGIDLGGDGVSPNDNDSQQVGQPNRKQNFPVITSAIGEGFKGTVAGTFSSTPGTYTVQVFASPTCDSSGYGEGTELVGSATSQITISAGGEGPGSFSIPVVGFFVSGYTHITATLTDSVGDTSEFSQCFDYTDDQIFGNGFDPSGFF